MTMKKTLRVLVDTEGFPIIVPPQKLDKTSELPACEACSEDEQRAPDPAQAAPRQIVADDITVPVHSSIESTLTFEMLRRQSTEADDDDKHGDKDDKGNKGAGEKKR